MVLINYIILLHLISVYKVEHTELKAGLNYLHQNDGVFIQSFISSNILQDFQDS